MAGCLRIWDGPFPTGREKTYDLFVDVMREKYEAMHTTVTLGWIEETMQQQGFC